MSRVRIAGTGMTPFGKYPGRTGRDLFAEAGLTALDDASIPPEDIDEIFFGNFLGILSENQGHQGPLVAEAIGSTAPAQRIEGACASSGLAIRNAVRVIRSGQADVVVAGGMERMTNLGTADATAGLAAAADDLYEIRAGMTFPAAYALMARAYFEEFGGSPSDLASIAIKNHRNATGNDHAHLQTEISRQEYEESPDVADPLRLLDACPISDGASAIVVTSEEYATNNDIDAPVAITGSGQGGDRLALQNRTSLTRTPATNRAAHEAYDDAGVTTADVDLAEVHDCFTIAEVLALEALDLYEDGQAIGAARRGETTRDGRLPVNLSGGLKAKGHPVGATGTAQIVTVEALLSGTHHLADSTPEADVGIAHNAGGTVASATVHVLEVVE